jgi:hypothetical protein
LIKFNLLAADALKEVHMPSINQRRVILAGFAAIAFGSAAGFYVYRVAPREVSHERFLIEIRQKHFKSAIIYPLDHIAVAGNGKAGAIRTVLADDDQTFLTTLRSLGVELTFTTSDSLIP